MFIQLNMDKLTLPEQMLDSHSAGDDRQFLGIRLLSSTDSRGKMVDNVPLISSVTRDSELVNSVSSKIASNHSTAVASRVNRHFVSNVKVVDEEEPS